MKRSSLLLIGLSALAVGGIAGYYHAGFRYGNAVVKTVETYKFVITDDVLTNLRDLRAGNTNAVFEALEAKLDHGVLVLDGFLNDNGGCQVISSLASFDCGIPRDVSA